MVRETCQLANDNIIWHKETNSGETEELDLKKLTISTNDPAPPFNYLKEPEKYTNVESLKN
jgi:deoxyhypusine monooxygenase